MQTPKVPIRPTIDALHALWSAHGPNYSRGGITSWNPRGRGHELSGIVVPLKMPRDDILLSIITHRMYRFLPAGAFDLSWLCSRVMDVRREGWRRARVMSHSLAMESVRGGVKSHPGILRGGVRASTVEWLTTTLANGRRWERCRWGRQQMKIILGLLPDFDGWFYDEDFDRGVVLCFFDIGASCLKTPGFQIA